MDDEAMRSSPFKQQPILFWCRRSSWSPSSTCYHHQETAKNWDPKKKIYSKYCTLVCIGHAMSAVCLETKQVSCTLQNKDKNQKTSKLESSSGNKTYKANSKMVPKSWPNNNMCNEWIGGSHFTCNIQDNR